MVQKEKESLWRIKHLLTRLTGDNTWIPCESVETENDFHLFIDERDRNAGNILQKVMSRNTGLGGSRAACQVTDKGSSF